MLLTSPSPAPEHTTATDGWRITRGLVRVAPVRGSGFHPTTGLYVFWEEAGSEDLTMLVRVTHVGPAVTAPEIRPGAVYLLKPYRVMRCPLPPQPDGSPTPPLDVVRAADLEARIDGYDDTPTPPASA